MSSKAKKPEKNAKKKNFALIICVVIITVLLVTIIILLVRGKDEPEEKRNVVVTPDNVEEILAEMDEAEFVEPGYYTVNMNTEWHFSRGDAVSEDARVDNLAENTNDVYFDVFLVEDETNPIYKSPVIPVGSFLEHIVLDEALDAGTYDCVMIYHLVDEEQNTISTLRVAFTIVVES